MARPWIFRIRRLNSGEFRIYGKTSSCGRTRRDRIVSRLRCVGLVEDSIVFDILG